MARGPIGGDAIGALRFTNPRSLGVAPTDWSATCALADGSTRALSDALVEIPSGKVWWTNLDYADLKQAGLIGRPDLKTTSFLPTRQEAMLAEMGLRDETDSTKTAFCAHMIRCVLMNAQSAFELPLHPDGVSLPNALRSHVFNFSVENHSSAVQYAIDSACQAFTRSGSLATDDTTAQMVVFRHHRQHYAARMIDEPVPAGEWRETAHPEDPSQTMDWVRDSAHSTPLLLRVNVRFRGASGHDRALLAGMGAGANSIMVGANGTRQSNTRQWVAAPEFVALSQYADIEVLDTFAADCFVPNPWHAINPVTFGADRIDTMAVGPLRLSGQNLLNYADGLLSEAMWVATSRNPGVHRDNMSMWMQSVDRAQCLNTAFGLQSLGLIGVQVTGFSRGRIWTKLDTSLLRTDEDVNLQIASIAEATGLIPPVLRRPGIRDIRRLAVVTLMQQRAKLRGLQQVPWLLAATCVLGRREFMESSR